MFSKIAYFLLRSTSDASLSLESESFLIEKGNIKNSQLAGFINLNEWFIQFIQFILLIIYELKTIVIEISIYFHNLLRIFDVLLNFLFTASDGIYVLLNELPNLQIS